MCTDLRSLWRAKRARVLSLRVATHAALFHVTDSHCGQAIPFARVVAADAFNEPTASARVHPLRSASRIASKRLA